MNEAPAPLFTPVNLLTGFLGAGKTTLLKRLLQQPALADAAVLVNEFGEIGLDHLLLERIDEQMVLLPSGCLCCTVRGELAEALRALHSKRERGEVPWFRRVVIETTGLADPFPILSTLQAEPVLRHHFALGQVVAVVDAVHGAGQLQRHAQSVRQVAAADQIVVSKLGLADPSQAASLKQALHAINPMAPVWDAESDAVDAEALFCQGLFDAARKSPDARRWLSEERAAPSLRLFDSNDDEVAAPVASTRAGDGRYLAQAQRKPPSTHTAGLDVTSFSIVLDEPLDWTAFAIWLTMFVHRHGERVLRIKGIVNVRGSETPVAVHGVQHLIHPPLHLAAWPGDARQSSIVFIVDGLEPERVRRSLRAFVGGAA